MKKQIWILILIVVVIIVGLIIFVPKSKKQVVEKKTIKIGAIYQETGSGADWGANAEKGIKLAVEKINSEGGINGRMLQVVYEDSKSNAADALTAMNKLLSIDKVNIVFSQQSGVVVALSPIANSNEVILMDTGATTPLYTSANDFTFRTSYNATYFANEVVSYLNKKEIKTAGVLYVNNEYGLSMFNAYRKNFAGQMIVVENFSENSVDFRTQLQKIKNANPQVFLFVADPKQAGIIIKQKRELGFNAPSYSDTYSVEYQSFLDIAGDSAEGIIYVSPLYNVSRTDATFKEFNEKFQQKYNEVSNPLSAQAYDGVMIMAFAMEQCKNFQDSECLKNKLFGVKDFMGVIGKIIFDETGEVLERPTKLKTIKNGQFVPYEE